MKKGHPVMANRHLGLWLWSLLGAVALAGLLAAVSWAAAKPSSEPVLRLVTPKGTVAAGKPPLFTVKVTKAGTKFTSDPPFAVFIAVARSSNVLNSKDKKNLLYLARMNPAGHRTYTIRPKPRKHPSYWLNTADTYFVQPFIVRCEANVTSNCRHAIPAQRLVVR